MNESEFYLDSPSLSALQAEAAAAGRECVVGALIRNEDGAIFVQKRTMDRQLFPGCWDIAGGHVEAGETLFEALAREIEEETGWQLVELLSLVKVFDWEEERNGRIIKNCEFDFLVRVDGDLTAPRIEVEKFSEYRWITWSERKVLLENRPFGDRLIYDLVSQAFEIMLN